MCVPMVPYLQLVVSGVFAGASLEEDDQALGQTRLLHTH